MAAWGLPNCLRVSVALASGHAARDRRAQRRRSHERAPIGARARRARASRAAAARRARAGRARRRPRAPATAERMLALLPDGAQIVVELDLARLRANPVVGDARDARARAARRRRAAAGAAARGAGLAARRRPTRVVLAAYGVGTAQAATVTVLATHRPRCRARRGSRPISSRSVPTTGSRQLEARAAIARQPARARRRPPSCSRCATTRCRRARPARRCGSPRGCRSTRASRSRARPGSTRAPAQLSLWGDVADDLAIVVDADAADPGDTQDQGRGAAGSRATVRARARGARGRCRSIRALGVPTSLADARLVAQGTLGARDHRDRSAPPARASVERASCDARRAAVMKLIVEPATRPLSGTVTIPGDKSIGHRALLFSLLSQTPVRVLGLGDGADNGRSAKAITALGATIERDGAALVITGTGLDGMRAPAAPIDCGNSGTTIRLLCGLLAGPAVRDDAGRRRVAVASARCARVIEPLAQMGASITGSATRAPTSCRRSSSARRPARCAAIDYALPMASAQVKTAILLAGLYADGATRVTEPGPSRDHTERMLAYLGAPLASTGRDDDDRHARLGSPARGRRLRGAGAIRRRRRSSSPRRCSPAPARCGCPNVCVNPTRTGFLDAIAAMGGTVALEDRATAGPEPVADARRARRRRASSARPRSPAISRCARSTSCRSSRCSRRARAAPRSCATPRSCASRSPIGSRRRARCCARSASRARCAPMASPSRAARIARSTPARVHADGDHRIAMAAAVARPRRRGRRRIIDDADNVATSYPGLRRRAARARRDDSQRGLVLASVVTAPPRAARAAAARESPAHHLRVVRLPLQ